MKECSGQGTRRTGRIDKGNQASPCSVAMAWDGPDRFFVCCHGPGWFPAGGLALCTSAAGLAQICARTEQEEAAGWLTSPSPVAHGDPPAFEVGFRGPLRPGGLTSFLGYLSMSTGEPVCNGYYLTMLFSSSWTLTVFPVPAPVPQGLAGP